MSVLVFDAPLAQLMARRKIEHLEWLAGFMDLSGRVLEPGCGVCDLTSFFVTGQNKVLSTEGRPENVEVALLRHPNYDVRTADLESFGEHSAFGHFDIVFLYGVLYHLKNPSDALRELASVCDRLMLVSVCVHHEDNGRQNPIGEDSAAIDQALHGWGCRPGRDWVWSRLKEHFEFVYIPRYQPRHSDYSGKWPHPSPGGLNRFVLVASRQRIVTDSLLCRLPERQEIL